MNAAKNGDTVKIHYTGTLDDGKTFGSSIGEDPLQFTIGKGELIPAIEKGVIGLSEGESKQIYISAHEGYGAWQENLVSKIPFEQLPEDLKPEIDMKLKMRTTDDQLYILRIIEISEKDITVDANHELAGKNLTFDIELIEIVS